jgi:hypothetical protein
MNISTLTAQGTCRWETSYFSNPKTTSMLTWSNLLNFGLFIVFLPLARFPCNCFYCNPSNFSCICLTFPFNLFISDLQYFLCLLQLAYSSLKGSSPIPVMSIWELISFSLLFSCLECVLASILIVATWVQLVRRVAQEPSVRGSNPSGARVQSNECYTDPRSGVQTPTRDWGPTCPIRVHFDVDFWEAEKE